MDMQRIKDDIGIILFSAILSFTIVLSVAGMANTVSKLDYRIQQAKQEIADAKR
jgi:putative effector of murein hydrolase LrgA (UPF0299 family)